MLQTKKLNCLAISLIFEQAYYFFKLNTNLKNKYQNNVLFLDCYRYNMRIDKGLRRKDMKFKRSERLIDMVYYLLEHPHQLITLSYFTKKYHSAKSSISEDLVILKKTFAERGIGKVETISGAAGGVRFIPLLTKGQALEVGNHLVEKLADPSRLLPGGFMYLSDVLVDPELLRQLGHLIASKYAFKQVTAVVTVATKGIPIAQTAARYLNVPFVIVRRDSKITEGSTVSINYPSYRTNRVEKMEVSKKSLKKGDRVLIIDDFLNGGGTVQGMQILASEFEAETVGTCVLCELSNHDRDQVGDIDALVHIDALDERKRVLRTSLGSFFDDLRAFDPEK